MGALAGTAVPVPEMVLHCPDPTVLGAPFYLMRHVPGRVYREPAAVLDWEMSTLGDPLGDLALSLRYAGRLDVPGQPDTDELVACYAERSGCRLERLDWYLGFAAFKLAVILEGVHFRYVRGQTVGDGFDTVGGRVPPLITQGLERMRSA